MRRPGSLFLAALLLSAAASAQSSDPTITTAVVTNARQMTVVFSQPVAAGPAPHLDATRVRLLPDNVTPAVVTRNALATNTLALTFASVPETATRICFDQVQFPADGAVATSRGQVCADLSRDPASIKETWIAAFQSVPRTSRDKNIFASGFVTTASGGSSGGGDMSFNPNFNIPNLNAFLKIKKATADEGDARHFESGARYRYTRTWKRGEMAAIASETDAAKLNALIRDRQENVLAGWIIDVAAKLEGDPTNFDVTNFVGESALHLQTMTKGFLGRSGFWRGYLVPAGIEAGQSIGTTVLSAGTPEPAVDRIARYKAGAGVTVYYENPVARSLIRRVELDANGVLRHLFLAESRFDAVTRTSAATDDGLHVYGQMDVKVFVAETSAGRYGFKVSFNRGRLPPVYAQVKSVDFGFLMESGDGDDGASAARRASAARSARR